MLNQLQGVYSSLHKHQVKYLTIRGIAAILYGVPRATFDLDILIEATPENAQRLLDASLRVFVIHKKSVEWERKVSKSRETKV